MNRECLWCGEPLEAYDPHAAIHGQHRECGLRAIVGGANHLLKQCTCCGGKLDPDPPHLTKRQAAKVAMAIFIALPMSDHDPLLTQPSKR